MNRQIFGSRKGGATINGKFYPLTATGILSRDIERKLKKKEARILKSQRI